MNDIAHYHQLPQRQRDVLKLICEDMTVKAIAGELGISSKTVEYHKSVLYRKFKCGLAGLVRLAIKIKLIEP